MNWEKVNLTDIANVFNGKTPGKKELRSDGHPVLKIKDITESGDFVGKYNSFVDKAFFERYKRKCIKSGDTLILNAAHNSEYVGRKRCFANNDIDGAMPTGEWLLVRPKTVKVSASYIFYYLQSPRAKHLIKSLVKGIHLYPKDVANIIVPLPPLDIQRKIAAVLDRADRLRQLRKGAIEKLDMLIQALFMDMFGNFNDWPKTKLVDVSKIVSGVAKGRKLNNKELVSVPYMRVYNVQDGFIDISEIKYIDVPTSDVEKFRLIKNDILLTEGGDPDKLGRGAIWRYDIKDCIHQNHIFRVRLDQDILIPEYFSSLIGSSYGKKYFLKAAKQTTGIASINSKQLKNFPAIIPPLKLQRKYSKIFQSIEMKKKLMDSSLNQLDTLFNSLLQRAFQGELAFNDDVFAALEEGTKMGYKNRIVR